MTPDLATFAKIVAGGFPGGAVAGRKDVMDVLTLRDDREWNLRHRVPHQGTFNANPITAAAGLATLKLVAQGHAIEPPIARREHLRDRLNEVIRQAGSNWIAYGVSPVFIYSPIPSGRQASVADI